MIVRKSYSLGSFFVGFIFGTVACVVPMTASASMCVQINSDLSYGQTDSTYGGPILALQNYLQSLGYLSATPNGHFGQSTLLGVKAYQKANSISSTGYVGPLTRASISQKTCSTGVASNVTVINNSSIQSSPVSVATPEVSSNVGITSPATGQVLSIGSSNVIRWNVSPSNIYNINLEQPGGAGAGFIALNQSPNISLNQYVWNAGKVLVSQANSTQSVLPGTYRIRLQGVSSGANSTDQVSGWFTIVAQQFSANSVVPSSSPADNVTSVVLFGLGLTSSVSVYFDSNYSSLRANNEYVSPDGTILVFTIPTNVPAGPHTLIINNGISSTPISLPFTVSSIQ
jgi:hypothetical protein